MDCLPLKDLTSVRLGGLSYYVDGIQDVPQVQDVNELISRHVRNLSFFSLFLSYRQSYCN